MDWNWYFSSIAQSTAAIVGLIGAFVATKIINNQAAFVKSRERARQLAISAEWLKARASNRAFAWYNKEVRKVELNELADFLDKSPPPHDAKKLYKSFDFSPFDKREDVLNAIDKRQSEWKPPGRAHGGFAAITPLVNFDRANLKWKEIQAEKEAIYTILADINQHIDKIKDFLIQNTGRPYSPIFISTAICLLWILFMVGVIAPLSFMPISKNGLPVLPTLSELLTVKGIILISVVTIFSIFLVLFVKINRELQLDTKILDELRGYSLLGSYSAYFETFVQNQYVPI